MKLRILLVVMLAFPLLQAWSGCKFSHQKENEYARQDSLAKDSTRRVVNPYKAEQGRQVYDQQREVIGNIDTLVTPQDPGIPGR